MDSRVESKRLQSALIKLAAIGTFSKEYATKYMSRALRIRKSAAVALIDELQDQGLFVVGACEADLLNVMRRWDEKGWMPAFLYHYSTRDYPFLDYALDGRDEDRELMCQYAAQGSRPANRKPDDGYLDFLTLPDVNEESEPEMTAEDWLNTFSLQPSCSKTLNLRALAFILHTASGVTGTKKWPGQGDFFFKRVPSGGARHPTELYLANIRCPDIPKAWYHYQGSKHGLGQLSMPSTADEMIMQACDAFPDFARRGPSDASVVFILSSVVERSMWRYRDSRSFRAILIDVGHVLNTLRLSASAAGIRHWVGHDLNDERLAAILKIDLSSEPVLFGGAIW